MSRLDTATRRSSTTMIRQITQGVKPTRLNPKPIESAHRHGCHRNREAPHTMTTTGGQTAGAPVINQALTANRATPRVSSGVSNHHPELLGTTCYCAPEQTLREKINAEETARMDGDQGIHRELSKSAEASQSRVRLWAEERLRKERAGMEESLERAHAESEMVRTLLDETVKAVSKELEILRAESRARNVALEDSLEERTSELEARLTEVDNGAVKKRRVSELTKETGARIGEVERRVRQVRLIL